MIENNIRIREVFMSYSMVEAQSDMRLFVDLVKAPKKTGSDRDNILI